jgi:hypothetical protein
MDAVEFNAKVVATVEYWSGWTFWGLLFLAVGLVHLIDYKLDFLSKYDPLPMAVLFLDDDEDQVVVQAPAPVSSIHRRTRG